MPTPPHPPHRGWRVLVLGGAGRVGRSAVAELSRDATVAAVTLGDQDVGAAAEACAALRAGATAQLEVQRLDVFDLTDLQDAMEGHDVVVSAIRTADEGRLVRAALDAGVPYVSACDRWEVTEEVMRRWHPRALDAGLLLVLGAGVSPGVSNGIAAWLARDLDTLESIDVLLDLPRGPAARALSAPGATWEAGARRVRRPARRSRLGELPGGTRRVWLAGHPETLTLPGLLYGVADVRFWVGGSLAAWGARLGVLPRVPRRWLARDGRAALRVEVRGDGGVERVGFLTCGLAEGTGVALAAAALLVARGEVTEDRGVLPAEAAFDARTWLTDLERRGLRTWRDAACAQPLLPLPP